MLRRLVVAALYVTGMLALAWVFFFVPIGRRTLWEHARRIAATPEAQDLGADVRVAGERAGEALQERVRSAMRDAGPRGELRVRPAEPR